MIPDLDSATQSTHPMQQPPEPFFSQSNKLGADKERKWNSKMRNSLIKDLLENPIYWATLMVLSLSALFLIAPELDIWMSHLFYSPSEGFWLKAYFFPLRLRKLGLFLPRAALLALALFALARLFWPSLRKGLSLPKVAFLGLSALLGPGLLVNGLLKANWGRARPIQTDLFAGDWPYSPVWVVTDHCQSNCSFVSGEGSMAFWLLGLVVLVPISWRKGGLIILSTLCFLISINRIAFGGHYLSDILLSWALTGWVMAVLYTVLQRQGWFDDKAEFLEEWWDDAGKALRTRLAKLWRTLLS